MKHTPGPWSIDEDGFILSGQLVQYKDGSGEYYSHITDYAGCGSHSCEWSNETDKRLVCAAPVMFEALRDLNTLIHYAIDLKTLTPEAKRWVLTAQKLVMSIEGDV